MDLFTEFESMITMDPDENALEHYGTLHESGRYEWGSGENGYQRGTDFFAFEKKLKDKGLTEKEIAKGFGFKSTTDYRLKRRLVVNADKLAKQARAVELKEKGYSLDAIGKSMGGVNESTVRGWLKASTNSRQAKINGIADQLKEEVDKYKYIDVGAGTHLFMNVNESQLKTSLMKLKDNGYQVTYHTVRQVATGKNTSLLILSKAGTPWKEVDEHKNEIRIAGMGKQTNDGGRTWQNMVPPVAVDPKRVGIRYDEEGGRDRDGMIQIRRGVPDLSLGNAKYAQVRINVNNTHYLKGVAVYGDDKDFPPGVDIMFNTNKSKGTPMIGEKKSVLKPMKQNGDGTINWDNPFGATIKNAEELVRAQKYYTDPKTGEKKVSALNIVNEEGDWNTWSRNIAAQMLSKQPVQIAKKQLDLMMKAKEDEFEDILKVNNPIVKQRLLLPFADSADSAAVHLKAAAMPRQSYCAILSVPELKPNEIYAPKYKNGEKLVLIRYPHGGKFEIPELTVNNNCKAAKAFMENAEDAVGINPAAASQLSGADFDGDSVIVIPNNSHAIKTAKPLGTLATFDPSAAYPEVEGMKIMTKKRKPGCAFEGMEMGSCSNLITDMQIKGATDNELERAVKYSMVVIDAAKHVLNFEQAYKDFGIADLKKKYQGGANRGASTIISRASADIRVPKRNEVYKIDPETGEKIWVYPKNNKYYYKDDKATGERIFYNPKNGEPIADDVIEKTHLMKSTKMYEEKDAYNLMSDPNNPKPIEKVYADHANRLKALGNRARLEFTKVTLTPYSKEAHQIYKNECDSLNDKLIEAKKNAPIERKAQIIANARIAAKIEDNPDLANDADEKKRLSNQILAAARYEVGAHHTTIDITDAEWEAIQRGALSNSKIKEILAHTDLDKIQKRATPRETMVLKGAKMARAKAMMNSHYTQSEIAEALGISVSQLERSFGKGAE